MSAAAALAMSLPPVLLARGVTKSFPGVLALDHVDFETHSGQVTALLGGKRRGQTTLIKMMAGFYAPDSGTITVNGAALLPDPSAAHRIGVGTIHRDAHLVPAMSVAENICWGAGPPAMAGCRRVSNGHGRRPHWQGSPRI